MKIITLARPAVIDGAVRYPVEGALTVSPDEAKRQKYAGTLAGEPEDLPVLGDDGEADDLDGLKVDDLKAIAAKEQVDLGEATKKADIVAAIRAARAG